MPFSKVFLSNDRNIAHYIDDYRLEDKVIVLCRWKNKRSEFSFLKPCNNDSVDICKTCIKVSENYPTKEQFFEYHSCTDCGTDLWSTYQDSYKIVNSIWKIAYPDDENGEVDFSRPCWNCLSRRIGRPLVDEDFVYKHL